jgi:hypothetical protein
MGGDPAPSADIIDAKTSAEDDHAGKRRRDLAKGGRRLGKKADGKKNPDGYYMYKLCCNDDWYCVGD